MTCRGARGSGGPALGTHSITAYSIHLEKRLGRDAGKRLELARLPDGRDLLPVIGSFIASLRDDLLSGDENRYYGRPTGLIGRGRTIEVHMVTGRNGLQSQIRLPDKGPGEHSFTRTPDHIEEVPVRQVVVVPRDSLTGYWFFELVGTHTVGEAYRRHFLRWFENGGQLRSVRPVLERIVTGEAWERIEDDPTAQVEQVRIVHARAAGDRSERIGLGGVKGPYVELYGSSKEPSSGSVLKRLRDRILEHDDMGRLVPAGDDVTEVTATVRVGGRRRQVTVTRARLPSMRMVLEDRGAGIPDDDEFFGTARNWAMELAGRDDVRLPDDWATGDWDPGQKPMGSDALFPR